MYRPFAETARRYRLHCSKASFWRSVVLSLIAFGAGISLNGYAIIYATERASNPVTDIILSNIPVFDVDGMFVYGAVVLIIFIVILLVLHPQYIPFTLYSLALFYVIRAMFIS